MDNKLLSRKQSTAKGTSQEVTLDDAITNPYTKPTAADSKASLSKLSESKSGLFTKLSQDAQTKWSELPGRDKVALVVLLIFLILLGGGYGGYTAHKAAKQQQENYQTAVNDFFWLRSQASNISPTQNDDQLGALDKRVLEVMTQMGAESPQAISVGEDVQISFSQINQNTVSNILGSIINSGLKVKQLNMQQNPNDKVIQVQATVSQ